MINEHEVHGIKLHTGFPFKRRKSFDMWMKEWNQCSDADTAINLLHELPDTYNEVAHGRREAYRSHKLIFLLRFAFGHKARGIDYIKPVKEKAFKLLRAMLFSKPLSNEIQHIDREVKEALFIFFQSKGLNPSELNVSWDGKSSHTEIEASEYLRAFCKQFWTRPSRFFDQKVSDQVRIEILKILHTTRALDAFFFYGMNLNSSCFDDFTPPVLLELRKMLGNDSLEVALWNGTSVARLLTVVQKGRSVAKVRKKVK